MTTPSISNHVVVLGENIFLYLPSSHVETPVSDRNPEAREKCHWYFGDTSSYWEERRGKGTYVKAQPNIDDLICAGMSSGPAIQNLSIIELSNHVDYGFCMSNNNKMMKKRSHIRINEITEQKFKHLLLLSWFNNNIQYRITRFFLPRYTITRLGQAWLYFI